MACLFLELEDIERPTRRHWLWRLTNRQRLIFSTIAIATGLSAFRHIPPAARPCLLRSLRMTCIITARNLNINNVHIKSTRGQNLEPPAMAAVQNPSEPLQYSNKDPIYTVTIFRTNRSIVANKSVRHCPKMQSSINP